MSVNKRALNAAAETHVPSMTHHTFSTIPVQQTGKTREVGLKVCISVWSDIDFVLPSSIK